MKKKKNIIKKIELNKIYKFKFKKGLKRVFKRISFKYKFFYKVGFFKKSFINLNKLIKNFKYNLLNINKFFIKKRYNYFNYISDGLDLKYNNLYQDLSKLNYINQFNKKKNIILKENNLDLIKYQKFITFLDNNYIYTINFKLNLLDFFKATNYMYYCILKNNYKLYLLLLIV